MITSNVQQEQSTIFIRKFKTQREKESREKAVDVEVVNLESPYKHDGKVNSMDEEESEAFAEDEDETGSLTESPVIKLNRGSNQNQSKLSKVTEKHHKKKNGFSTDLNSTSQNETSHHQFKLSISSVEDHYKKFAAPNLQKKKKPDDKKMTIIDKLSSVAKSKNQARSEQRVEKTKKPFYLTGVNDEISVIPQNPHEDEGTPNKQDTTFST